MSKFLTLTLDLALTSTSATTAIDLEDTPLNPYRDAVVKVFPVGATGTTTMLIEGSEDGGTTYSTLGTFTIAAASPAQFKTVQAYPKMRVRNSVAGSAGTANVYLEAI